MTNISVNMVGLVPMKRSGVTLSEWNRICVVMRSRSGQHLWGQANPHRTVQIISSATLYDTAPFKWKDCSVNGISSVHQNLKLNENVHLLNFILHFWVHKNSSVDRTKPENVMFPFKLSVLLLFFFQISPFVCLFYLFPPLQSYWCEYLELLKGLVLIQVLLGARIHPIMEVVWAREVVDFTSPIYDPLSACEAILISLNMREKPASVHPTHTNRSLLLNLNISLRSL